MIILLNPYDTMEESLSYPSRIAIPIMETHSRYIAIMTSQKWRSDDPVKNPIVPHESPIASPSAPSGMAPMGRPWHLAVGIRGSFSQRPSSGSKRSKVCKGMARSWEIIRGWVKTLYPW